MGLAASQARMLFLTARKSDIEFNQMSIANDKISMTRQTQEVAQAYSDALNQTKLTLNTTTTSGTTTNTADVTYGLLMNSGSALSSQYMFTDANGRAVLSDSDAEIIKGISGTSSGGFSLTNDIKKAYLAAKMGVSDDATLTSYITNYSNASSDSGTASLTMGDFLSAASGKNIKSSYSDLCQVTGEGAELDWKKAYDSDEVLMLANNGGSDGYQTSQMQSAGTNLEEILKNFISSMSSNSNLDSTALNSAMSATLSQFTDNADADHNSGVYNNNRSGDSTARGQARDNARDRNEIVAVRNSNHHAAHTFYAVNVKNLLDTFFTEYQIALGNTGSAALPYEITGAKKTSVYANSDMSVTKTSSTSGSSSTSTTNQSQADFYLNQLSLIASNGWVDASYVTDKSSLQNAIKNGSIYIDKYAGNGTWTQATAGDSSSGLNEVSDEAAITKAEAKYQADSAKLNSQEAQLDLKEKNLETERTEIDTEIDSVKSVISKNVERSFKMFA